MKRAVAQETKAKRGRKPEKDWKFLNPIIREDARRWLEGGDPFSERSNSSIATRYADEHPGQSRDSTYRRIMRKLSEERRLFTAFLAYIISDDEFPYQAHIKAISNLGEHTEYSEIAPRMLERAQQTLGDYAKHCGDVPDNLTMKEIRDRLQIALRPALPTLFPGGNKNAFAAYLSDSRPARPTSGDDKIKGIFDMAKKIGVKSTPASEPQE